MIRFNWIKLRELFTMRGYDRPYKELNRRRPWWLHVGHVYYVEGGQHTRWVLAGFDPTDKQGCIVTPATFGRGTETVHAGSLTRTPAPLVRPL